MIRRAMEEAYRLNAEGRQDVPIVFTRSEFKELRRYLNELAMLSPASMQLTCGVEEQTFCGHPIRVIEDIG
jgi:hypothetical protein